jgi:hypothetical protein
VNSRFKDLVAIFFCCILFVLILNFLVKDKMVVSADSHNPGLYATDSYPFEVPYSEWLTKWWQWSMSIPSKEHPRDNFSPEACSAYQEGPVWFLPDQLAEDKARTCYIPEGHAILVPLAVGECDTGSHGDYPDDDDSLIRCASEGNDGAIFRVTLDGITLIDLDQYRTSADFFEITRSSTDNVYEGPIGTYRAFAEGYYIMLEPLTAGQHDLTLSVDVRNPDPNLNYAAKRTYNLIVEPLTNGTEI